MIRKHWQVGQCFLVLTPAFFLLHQSISKAKAKEVITDNIRLDEKHVCHYIRANMLRHMTLVFLLLGQASSVDYKGENITAVESVRKLTPADMEAKLLPLGPFLTAAGFFGLLGLENMTKGHNLF
ncbi:unnamed protein product [Cylicocyclus nassatus]|uniref:Uncharacterized protein n=1 Tax=Cylicocyclus nassatus TaxID=53992 RepID=A0AA36DU22_CYLNA|nr:unnamed protein product [Cylicocyclus nassatus]